MKKNLIQISATTPTFATFIIYFISLVFLLIGVSSLSGDILSFLVMGLLGILLLVISMSLLYFKLISTILYARLKMEAYVAMTEKTQELIDSLVKQEYVLKQKTPMYLLEKNTEFKILTFMIYLILGILPGIIYLIVVQELGSHSVSFELGGKVYKDVTIDMVSNKLKYNS